MQELLYVFAVGLALFVGLRAYAAVWRWRCPRCGARALRRVGTAAIYPASADGPFDIRFAAARCNACGQPAYRRLAVAASWEPEMRACPEEPPPPPLPAAGGASEIAFEDAAAAEGSRGGPRE